MNAQRLTQLLHPNHKQLNQITVIFLVVIASLLMGLIPWLYGSGSTNIQGDKLIIPTTGELWSPLGEVLE